MWHLCFGLQAGLKWFLAAFVLRLLRRAEQGWSSVLGSWLAHQHLGAQHRCPARPAPPQVAAICLCFGSPGPAGRCCRALPALFPKKCFQPPSARSGCRVWCLQRSTPASGLHFLGRRGQLWPRHARGGTGAGQGDPAVRQPAAAGCRGTCLCCRDQG